MRYYENSHYSTKVIAVSTNPSVETPAPTTPNPNLIVGLAMTGGLGILLVIVGFLLGVFDPNLSSNVVALFVLAGILFLIGAIATWTAVVRPFDHFDDINVAQYHGHEHHDDHAHEEHSEETEGEVNADAPVPVDNVKVYPHPASDSAAH
jgi:uncharacterized protein YqhQ